MRSQAANRLRVGRAAWGGGLAVLLLTNSGCGTDWGVRSGPSLDEIGEGLLAFGAFLGAGAGFCALTEAGGGENMEYLGTAAYEHQSYDPWR